MARKYIIWKSEQQKAPILSFYKNPCKELSQSPSPSTFLVALSGFTTHCALDPMLRAVMYFVSLQSASSYRAKVKGL